MRQLELPQPGGGAVFFEADRLPNSVTQTRNDSHQFEDIVAPGNYGHVPRSEIDLEAQTAYEITQEQLGYIGLPPSLASALDIRDEATAQFLVDEMTYTEQMAGSDPASATQSMNERWLRLFQHLDAINASENDIVDTAEMYQAYCQTYLDIDPDIATMSQLVPRHLGNLALAS